MGAQLLALVAALPLPEPSVNISAGPWVNLSDAHYYTADQMRAHAIAAAELAMAKGVNADLLAALQSIIAECAGPDRPYSGDSYLPPHLVEAAQAAISKATTP